MKKKNLSRWALVGLVGAALLVIAVSATSQTQQRVETTAQLSVPTAVAADPFADWEQAYAEAIEVAKEYAEVGQMDYARRLFDDLEDLDRTLREFVRVSERLREKERIYMTCVEDLVSENALLMESRQYDILMNARQVRHDTLKSIISNMK